ncbi:MULTISPECIES: MtrAB system accessory lipoprotein LpqB [unclassified Corynebacterium]|uniref:MtrAB system accessory lipoprotein LpqB n=1 Tax=unclassified Corynebacterium TaxID=2624378 RepID=UPI0021677576|nr:MULTISPECIES: MtrAB system accessory lipoprotein LpqB [unclassified Corynebacterium]MCS4489483.1 MtrAB system accessory lipoprotein LpqB [Corynebacterium sp. ES2775-CONJ]MCS4491506.1 MtrAB system accessory lipoprotein LpqB [Corynebacterium sp. ES2715-CONJ3]MCS4531394.1 MtrAB system accessory lipoprotein LpqB [Corynebacterium sp. ES2730-CONJ]
MYVKNPCGLIFVVVSISALTGCVTLPSTSEPQALRSLSSQTPTQEPGPILGREPDLLVRDFYAASANPSQNYQQARHYLTASFAQKWAPQPIITVLDRIDMSSNIARDTNKLSYTITGTVVGTISEGGAYNPQRSDYRADVELVRVDGQWRISNSPNEIVVERTELRNRYLTQAIFFFNPAGDTLVADQRWVYSGSSSLGSALISLIIAGPSKALSPGVLDQIPATASFVGIDNGIYQLAGFAEFDDDARHRLAAQLVWTLATAGIAGPYRFDVDGVPLLTAEGDANLTVDDFPEFNPQAARASSATMYALTGGSISQVSAGQESPVTGPLGTLNDIESFNISAQSKTVALVRTNGSGDLKQSQLLIGDIDGALTTVAEARTFTQPTFENKGKALWVVADGNSIKRIARSESSKESALIDVDIADLDLNDNSPDISAFALSNNGVRAAFIIDGYVYIATVSTPRAGERKLSNRYEILQVARGSAVSLDWGPEGTLYVGTSSSDTPVWRAEPDGSSALALSSGNIVAPVVNLSSNQSAVYITDARASLQLSTTGSATYWREIQGLEGERAVTVIPQ